MNSPLTNNSQTVLKKTISTKEIIDSYKVSLGIDVSSYFINVPTIHLHECSETNYKFYTPFTLNGNGGFYSDLQKFKWYYMPWKWEHEFVKKKLLISKEKKILEVGCGAGGFVSKLHESGFNIVGLELNEVAVKEAQLAGLNILGQTIQKHAEDFPENYDVVCSFQVLEHIPDVYSFISSKIRCLKKGGKLIICVPNNDSFIKYDVDNILNMPPHHMGLWNQGSLTSLQNIFSLKLDNFVYEPLQVYHGDWYISLLERRLHNISALKYLYYKLRLYKKMPQLVSLISSHIKGHSILAIYTKI